MTYALRALALLPLLVGCVHHVGRPLAPPPPAVAHETVVERDVPFTPAGWPVTLLADLHRPAGPPPFWGWPAVLVIHGGGWDSGERAQVERIARRVARRGYVAMNVTYRLAPAARFPAALADLQQAVLWLRAHAAALDVDPTRVAAFGYSAGGHLAALLGGIGPGEPHHVPGAEVQAVVAGGAPTDLRKFQGGVLVPRFLGERWSEGSRAFREASPVAHVSPGDPPVFLYHAAGDTLVPADHARDYRAALEAAGVPNELYVRHGFGHILMFLFDDGAVQRALEFLDRWLASPPLG